MKCNVTDLLNVTDVNKSYDVHMVFDEEESMVDRNDSTERKLDKFTEIMSSLDLMHIDLKSKISEVGNVVSMVKKEIMKIKRSEGSRISDFKGEVNPNPKPRILDDRPSRLLVDSHGNKFKKFERGDANPKGGLYSFNYGERIYLNDEKKFGQVVGETQYYCWIRVDDEDYQSAQSGRRKLKPNVQTALNYQF